MSDLKIIGFDGVDGSGKSALINKLLLCSDLKDKVVFTTRRQPSSPYIAEMYSIIHTFKESYSALRLFVEDMSYRYSVMPSDKIIFSDRTFFSAKVFYESIAELSAISDEALYSRINESIRVYTPTLQIILLSDVNIARERILKDRGHLDSVEELMFQHACAKRYAAVKPAEDVLIIDTDQSSGEEVCGIVLEQLLTKYNF